MNMKRILLIAAVLVAAPSQAAQFTLSTGLNYSSGDYGGASKTQLWYVPVTGKVVTGPMTLKLTVPYLRVKAPSNVTVIVDSGAGGSSGVGGGESEGEGDGGGGTAPSITTRDGLGDVTFSMAYKLWDDSRMPVGMDVGGKIKFGTADTSKGLGTGKNDYNLYTEIYRVWDNKLNTFINIGYRWYGDTASTNFRNAGLFSAGLAYPMSRALSVGLDYGYRQKLLTSLDAASEATTYLNYKLPSGHKLQFYAVKGFTRASPDWGAGMTIAMPF
jgi:hypothetical protein